MSTLSPYACPRNPGFGGMSGAVDIAREARGHGRNPRTGFSSASPDDESSGRGTNRRPNTDHLW